MESKIEWTDYTFNPWSGCTKVSPGCANCYAEVNYSVKMRGVKWGPSGNRIVAAESGWKKPLAWEKAAFKAQLNWKPGEPNPVRPRVFCASLADVFEDWQGPMLDSQGCQLWNPSEGKPPFPHQQTPMRMQDVRNRLFALIDSTPNLDWLVLTKRPENIAKMMPVNHDYEAEPPRKPFKITRPNLWLGVSVENQKAADERIPELLKIPAAVRFLSVEPLLGPVDLEKVVVPNPLGGIFETSPLRCDSCGYTAKDQAELMDHGLCRGSGQRLHWIIIGGESGPNARPCNVEWIRSIVRQCKDAGVACFVKQLGSKPSLDDGMSGNPLAILDRKGGDMKEWPEDLRVREFPRAQ